MDKITIWRPFYLGGPIEVEDTNKKFSICYSILSYLLIPVYSILCPVLLISWGYFVYWIVRQVVG